MARTRLGFDIGGSSLKAAVVRDRGIQVHELRLPENLVDENGIAMPQVFIQF